MKTTFRCWQTHRSSGLLVTFEPSHFLGTKTLDAIIKEVVIISLSMPPVTIDDFFGENIIANLAAFLGVPDSKIRIVNIVRETGSRRKRADDSVTLDMEIGKFKFLSLFESVDLLKVNPSTDCVAFFHCTCLIGLFENYEIE